MRGLNFVYNCVSIEIVTKNYFDSPIHSKTVKIFENNNKLNKQINKNMYYMNNKNIYCKCFIRVNDTLPRTVIVLGFMFLI